MADPITATFETKRIEELSSLNKLTGKEELLIDNGDTTLKVTVDTLLGYIRDQINGGSASGGSSIEIGGEKGQFLISDGSGGLEYATLTLAEEGEY